MQVSESEEILFAGQTRQHAKRAEVQSTKWPLWTVTVVCLLLNWQVNLVKSWWSLIILSYKIIAFLKVIKCLILHYNQSEKVILIKRKWKVIANQFGITSSVVDPTLYFEASQSFGS